MPALPRVAREWNAEAEQPMIDRLIASEIDGFLVRAAGQFAQVQKSGKKIVVDYNLNAMNRQTVEYWKEQGRTMSVFLWRRICMKSTAWGIRTAKWWFTAICR